MVVNNDTCEIALKIKNLSIFVEYLCLIKFLEQLSESTANKIPIYDSLLLLVTAIIHILTAQYLDPLIHCGCISSIL